MEQGLIMAIEKSVFLNSRVPESLRNDFRKKYPTHGKRSKVIRGLIQMLLNGDIKTVKYTETDHG